MINSEKINAQIGQGNGFCADMFGGRRVNVNVPHGDLYPAASAAAARAKLPSPQPHQARTASEGHAYLFVLCEEHG